MRIIGNRPDGIDKAKRNVLFYSCMIQDSVDDKNETERLVDERKRGFCVLYKLRSVRQGRKRFLYGVRRTGLRGKAQDNCAGSCSAEHA